MDLYLLRHGYAEPFGEEGRCDEDRALTPIGRELLLRAAPEMRRRGVSPGVILSSPFRRARETAELLLSALSPPRGLLIVEVLASGVPPESLLEVVGSHEAHGPVLLVGHNPEIDATVRILAARAGGAALPMRPGTLAWFNHAQYPRYPGIRFHAQWEIEDLAEAALEGR
jgi:phosphohistidine phosphatase